MHHRIGVLASLLALFLAVSAGAQATPALSVIPNPAPADSGFRLYLLGFSATCIGCNPTTFRESVAVNGDRIDLRAVVSTPIVPVAAGIQPVPIALITGQAPAFSLPPLRSGTYAIWVAMVPECLYLKSCTIPEQPPVSLGNLEVTPGVSATYILNPGSAPSARPFDLQLLSGGYSCATAFDSLAAEVSGDVITLTFHDYERPMGCAFVYEIFGPTFRLPALPAGTYRVKVERLSKQSVFGGGILEVVGPTVLGEVGTFPARASRAGLSPPGTSLQVVWRGHPVDFAGRRAPRRQDAGKPGHPTP